MKFFSIAALALVGAVMTSCSSSDDLTENTQQPQPASGSKVETFTTTVGLDGGTRALTPAGIKTFAVGETMAIIYNNGTSTVKAVSHELRTEDIAEGNKSATFTFDLETPNKTGAVMYIYPAAMATETDPFLNYNALYTEQNGTLTKLASNFDYCLNVGYWSDGNLPSLTLVNDLAILKLTFKNDADGSNITNSITGLTVSDGKHTYNVTRETGDGPIYVAIIETEDDDIEVTATDGTNTYAKALSGKSYARSNIYPITWKMAEVIKGKFSVSSTKQVYFSKGNLQATTSNNGTNWTWAFAANQWDKIGSAAANTSITNNKTVSTNGTVDLFGWSTSQTYLGIHNSTNNNDYRGSDFVEWGSAKEVTDCIGTGWRTLTSDEWRYLLVTRTTTSGKHYCKAQVDGHPGVILLPDDWNTSNYDLKKCDVVNLAFNASDIDKISLVNWNSIFVPHGAVFLPTTGQREGTTVTNENGRLYYWSATTGANTSGESANANQVSILGNALYPDTGAGRHFGNAVRLVRDVK